MRPNHPLRSVAFILFTILTTASCSSGGADEALVGSESEITGRVSADATLRTTQRAYLRSEAKKDPDNILDILDEGARLTPESTKPKGNWYKVRTEDGDVGYVLGKYLEVVEDATIDLDFGDEDEEDPVDESPEDLEGDESIVGGRTFGGTFSKSGTVPFGGGDHCRFQETMSDGVVRFEVSSFGKITGGQVNATSTEKILDGCTKSPLIPPQAQEWRFMKEVDGEYHFSYDDKNTPPSFLVVTGDFTKSPTQITLLWKRKDYTGTPLEWKINMQMKVSSK